MVTKSRYVELTAPLFWETQTRAPLTPSINKGGRPPLSALQTTVTENHGWPIKGSHAEDVGGDFSTVKVELINNTPEVFTSVWSNNERYIGPAFPVNMLTLLSTTKRDNEVPFSSSANLDRLGTTAIARVLPTNSASDAATFIGELKAGLPKMIGKELFKTKFKDYRKVGDEYLNVEFGWKPLVADVMKFGEAARDSEKIIRQLHRDSGRLVRRKYSFPDEIVTFRSPNQTNQYPWVPSGLTMQTGLYRPGVLETYNTRITKTWFSGAFTYHLNLGTRIQDKLDRHAAEARKLFGVEVTPETMWNLAPWSWIVDWEGNIGDAIHNISAFSQDGLVMPYGYIMQEKQNIIDLVLNGGIRCDRPVPPLSIRVIYTSKIRRKATPFGFGFDMKALTGRQSAILGALGLSRGPRR